jgi:hypothetical protein
MGRSTRLVLFAIALLLVAVGVGIGYGLVQTARYDESARHQAADYAKRTRESACKGLPVATVQQQRRCLDEKENGQRLADYDKQRDYDDLVAQKTSALWTMLTGIGALAGLAMSLIGVWLVYTTFRETKRGADAAHDANRPWIKLEVATEGLLTLNKEGAQLELTLKLTNLGNSPALHVNAFAVIHATRGSAPAIIFHGARKKAEDALLQRTGSLHDIDGITVFPSESSNENLTCQIDWSEAPGVTDDRSALINLGVGVIYHFGANSGRTVMSYDVVRGFALKRFEILDEEQLCTVALLDSRAGFAD